MSIVVGQNDNFFSRLVLSLILFAFTNMMPYQHTLMLIYWKPANLTIITRVAGGLNEQTDH